MNKFGDNITDMYVGALTVDEIAFAGSSVSYYNNYYLLNEYQNNNLLQYWTLSPKEFYIFMGENMANAFIVNEYGGYDTFDIYNNVGFRPAIALRENITTNGLGNGTQANPYVIQ